VTEVMAESFVRVNELVLYETEDGIMSLTTMVTVVVALPPVLAAVTVYVAEEVTAVGVPESSPVDESMTRPAGSVGETVQVTTGPPLEVGVAAVMLLSLVKVNEFGL